VALFSESLLPHLAERCEIKLFTDSHPVAPTPILRKFSVAPLSALTSEASEFDAILYHMGNHHRFHKGVFETLLEFPGVTLLHDCVLNQFFAKYALERGNFGMFQRLFRLCYGDARVEEAQRFIEVKGDSFKFPMAGVVAMRSRGVIVMSEYGRGIVRSEAPGAQVLRINFPCFRFGDATGHADAPRRRFDIAEKCLVVTSIGHMTPAKRIDVALEAFGKFNEKFPNSVFLLAGDESPRLSLDDMIARSSVRNARRLGYLERADLDALMELSDICVNLRYPSNGEMSASLMEMLGRGKVVAVSDYAQFAEFPDEICVKIGLGPNETDDLARELLDLAQDEARRRRIGEAAKERVELLHGPGQAAEDIVRFAKEHCESEPPLAREKLGGLLVSDPLLRRSGQMLAYNARRFAGLCRENGALQTARQALRRALAGPT
jgi:glycosyltransferase involved in cell wall biosynthesis